MSKHKKEVEQWPQQHISYLSASVYKCIWNHLYMWEKQPDQLFRLIAHNAVVLLQ